jgi:drug/metabolite transporter (DMT)-like permease
MGWGLLFSGLAALTTAAATIMQAIGARRAHLYRTVDPRLLLALIKSLPYVIGLVLITVSFGLSVIALHSTPLYVVQAIGAGSLAVIAGYSTLVYKTKLLPVEWIAVAGVFAGGALLVIGQRPSEADNLPLTGQWALLGAALLLGVIAFVARAHIAAALCGMLGGFGFGIAAVGSRIVARVDQSFPDLLTDPVTYAVAFGGLMGTLLFATALQRGSVTAVFGVSTVGQTLGPAAVGWLLLGDGVEPGMLPEAAVGFALAVVGAVVLGRHAHPHHLHTPEEAEEPAPELAAPR